MIAWLIHHPILLLKRRRLEREALQREVEIALLEAWYARPSHDDHEVTW